MPTLQFKGKSVIENYHHTVPHHRLEFDARLSCLPKGEKPSLDGNLIIEGDNLLALKALLPTHAHDPGDAERHGRAGDRSGPGQPQSASSLPAPVARRAPWNPSTPVKS